MATTEVEICNIALFRVRAAEIGDLNEQSVNAEKCRVLYPEVRDAVLAEGVWGFANTTRALALTGGTTDQWDYVYDYPNDCLNAHYIVPPGGSGDIATSGITLSNIEFSPIPFEILNDDAGTRAIVTNHENAILAYTKYVTDVRLFDPMFQEALKWSLAAELALPLGGDSGSKYRDQALKAYNAVLNKAFAQNRNQQWPRMHQQRPREIQARSGSVYSHYHYNGQFYRRY